MPPTHENNIIVTKNKNITREIKTYTRDTNDIPEIKTIHLK
jgi:hypothetical protein